MASKYLKRYSIPEGFEELLMEYTKEVLRNQPDDVIDFSCEYFRCLQEGLILDYDNKGENLPCDFETIIPKVPNAKANPAITQEEQQRYMKALEKARNASKLKGTTFNQNDYAKQDQDKQEREKEGMPQKKENTPKKDEKEEKQPEKEQSAEKDKEKPKIEIETKSKPKGIKELAKKKDREQTEESYKVHIKTTENDQQKTDDKNTFGNKLDFIELDVKENLLNELKEKNPDEVEKYIEEVHNPNKQFTDVIIKIQKDMNYFHDHYSQGAERDKFLSKYNETISSVENLPEIGTFIQSLPEKSIKEADDQFRGLSFYQQLLICYIARMAVLSQANVKLGQYLDDFFYFCFNPPLKGLLDISARTLMKYPWIAPFFSKSALYLQFDLFSLYHTRASNTVDQNYLFYTAYSIKKREMFINLYLILSLEAPKREKEKELDIFRRWYFNSSLEQINSKLKSMKGICVEEDIDVLNKKVENASKSLWQLLRGIVDMPVDIMDEFLYRFQLLDYLEQDIIMNYLALREDFSVIYDKFANVPRATPDNSHLKAMKHLLSYFNCESNMSYLNGKSNNELEKRVIRHELAVIEEAVHDDVKTIITEIGESNASNEALTVKRFSNLSHVRREIVCLIVLQLQSKGKQHLRIIDKIKLAKAMLSIDSYIQRAKFLNEYFSRDTLEYDSFAEEVKEWQAAFPTKLKGLFEKDKAEHVNYFKHNLNEEEKAFGVKMYHLLELMNEEEDTELTNVIKALSQVKLSKGLEERMASKKEKIIQKNKKGSQCHIALSLNLINYLENESDNTQRLSQFLLLSKSEKELVIETMKYRLGEDAEKEYLAELSPMMNKAERREDLYAELQDPLKQLNEIIEANSIDDESFSKLLNEIKLKAPEVNYIISEIKEKGDKGAIISLFLAFTPFIRQIAISLLKCVELQEKTDDMKQWIEELTQLSEESTQIERTAKLKANLNSKEAFDNLFKCSSYSIRHLYQFICAYPSIKINIEYANKLFGFLTVNERNSLIALVKAEMTRSVDEHLLVFIDELNGHLDDKEVPIDYNSQLVLSLSFWVSLLGAKEMKKFIAVAYHQFQVKNKALFDYFKRVSAEETSKEIDKATPEIKLFIDQMMVLNNFIQ